MSLLQGKHAFVTGGATGIGLAITRSLVDAGAQVTIASRDKDRSDEIAAELSAVEALAEIVKSNPQSRLIQTEEVANVVLWLCQPESRSITGQSIAVAGGEIT